MKLDIEKIVLILVFALLLWFGCANIYQNKLSHDYPHGFMAMDSFWKLNRAQTLDITGNQKYAPAYMAAGYDKIIESYPPLLSNPIVLFSNASGLELYDSIFLLTVLFSIFAMLTMYFVIKRFNENIALISLGISGFLFIGSFYVGYTWGRGPLMLGNLFLIAIFWAFSKEQEHMKKVALLLGLFIASAFLSHPPQATYGIAFIALFCIVDFLKNIGSKEEKEIIKKKLKNIAIALAIAAVLSSFYVMIFLNSERSAGIKLFTAAQTSEPVPQLLDFGIYVAFAAFGLFTFFFMKKNKWDIALLCSLFMTLIAFSNYLGSKRAFQDRYFLPIYLAVFFGIGVYTAGKFVIKEWSKSCSVVLCLVFVLIFMFTVYKPITSPGLANQYNWNAFSWISKNTDENAKILFFYGDSYGQSSILSNTFRESYLVNYDDYIDALNKQIVKRDMLTKQNRMKGNFLYEKGFASFGSYINDGVISYDSATEKRDICSFDYYVFDKAGSAQQLIDFNMAIRDMFMKSGMNEAYSNELVSILKNNKKGESCIIEAE